MRCLAFATLVLLTAAPLQAAQTLAIRYATQHGDVTWQLRVAGTQVIGEDDAGRSQWSVSPSEGAAADCDGLTQLALWLADTNADGRIDSSQGEHARLALSSSWRNGTGWDSAVLMLDVSQPAVPRKLWRQDSGSLPSLARLVAEPAFAALPGLAATSPVVILGAGLPTPATPTHDIRSGASLLLLDAEDGHELWRAAASGKPTQSFRLMSAGLSGAVTALDMNRDGEVDRLYVGDAVATLWRFDITPTAASPKALMSGGPIARLAAAANPTGRSLIAAPDVALFAPPGAAAWLNIAVGTTYTGGGISPVSQGLYVLRDPHPFDALTQAQYDSLPVATPGNLLGGYALDIGTDGIAGRALTAAGTLLYTQVEGDPLATCATPTSLIVKATAVDAETGAATAANATTSGPTRTPRVWRRPDGSTASPFDEPASLLDDIPALHRLKRRYWRREDAD